MHQLAEATLVLVALMVIYAEIVLGSGARWIPVFLGALLVTILLGPVLITAALRLAAVAAVVLVIVLLARVLR
jgi:hypothetical protein